MSNIVAAIRYQAARDVIKNEFEGSQGLVICQWKIKNHFCFFVDSRTDDRRVSLGMSGAVGQMLLGVPTEYPFRNPFEVVYQGPHGSYRHDVKGFCHPPAGRH